MRPGPGAAPLEPPPEPTERRLRRRLAWVILALAALGALCGSYVVNALMESREC